MPATPSYPGVYVQEAPSTSHAIAGVTTADAAFVGLFERGPVDRPIRITNFRQFIDTFGDLNRAYKATYGVYQFFLNGGAVAWVVRAKGNGQTATLITKAVPQPSALNDRATDPVIDLRSPLVPEIGLRAIGPGLWGNELQAATQPSQAPNALPGAFDLVIREVAPPTPNQPGPQVVASEIYVGSAWVVLPRG